MCRVDRRGLYQDGGRVRDLVDSTRRHSSTPQHRRARKTVGDVRQEDCVNRKLEIYPIQSSERYVFMSKET